MLNPLSFISKFIKSSNKRELDRISKIVTKINDLEKTTQNLNDSDFPKKTEEFKENLPLIKCFVSEAMHVEDW